MEPATRAGLARQLSLGNAERKRRPPARPPDAGRGTGVRFGGWAGRRFARALLRGRGRAGAGLVRARAFRHLRGRWLWRAFAAALLVAFATRLAYVTSWDVAEGHTGRVAARVFDETTGVVLAAPLIAGLLWLARRWPLAGVTVIHRFGRIAPGENIVLVATASAHRRAAFEAAEFLMDFLKTRAPFWKREHPRDGEPGPWVEARRDDDHAAERWGGLAAHSPWGA